LRQEEEKLEVEYRPLKKLVVLESVEMPQKELLESLVAQIKLSGQPVALHWAEGIVFYAIPLDTQSDLILDEMLKGTAYWASVSYAKMPSYQPVAKIGGVEIPVINQSRSPSIRQIAEWLKKRSGSV